MRKILLLLAEGFELYEASVFIDVFGWNMSIGSKDIKVVTCGFSKEVKTAFNQNMIADITISKFLDDNMIEDFDALAIPGGFKGYGYFKCAYRKEFLDVIRLFCEKTKLLQGFVLVLCQ